MKIRQTMLSAFAVLYGGFAFAGTTGGGGGLAWEAPLLTITDSFTGPVAFAASTIAVVVSLATLAFADNLSGAGRQLVYLVLIIAALIGVVNLLTTLFTAGAATGESVQVTLWVVSIGVLAGSVALATIQLRLAAIARRLFVRAPITLTI